MASAAAAQLQPLTSSNGVTPRAHELRKNCKENDSYLLKLKDKTRKF